jgi:hypothetical protein
MSTRFPVALFFVFATAVSVQAQDLADNPLFPRPRPKRIFVGPMAGYNSNFHSGGFHTLGTDAALANPECGEFTTGKGNGILGGLAAEYWFKPGGPTALQMRFYYEQKPGEFNSTSSPLPYVNPTTGEVRSFNRTYAVKSTYDIFNVEVQYKYNLPGSRFGVAIGPKFGFHMKSSYNQTESLSDGMMFIQPNANGGNDTLPTIVLADYPTKIPDVSGFRLALLAHVQYEVLVGPFLMTPRVLYDLGITKVTGQWGISSLAGTVEIKYGF